MQFPLSKKQLEFKNALLSRKYRYLLYGGGMGGGKTYVGVLMILATALQYPQTRYAVLRKNLTTLKKTTFQSFKTITEEIGLYVRYNFAEMKATLPNGSEVYFVEADSSKDKGFNKLRGFELTAAMMDEANEIAEEAFNIMMLRIGRCNKHNEPQYIILTTNPDDNWVKTRFYEPWEAGRLEPPYYFLPALAKDNPSLPKEYMDATEDLPEEEYQRFVRGNWNFSNDPHQLIKYNWVKDGLLDQRETATHMAVDVARSGDDHTVFITRHNNEMSAIETIKGQETTTIGQMVIEKATEKNIESHNIKIDVVGIGAGVVDYCLLKNFNVTEYNSGFSPTKSAPPFIFKNRRAQSYWNLRKKLEAGEIRLLRDPQLIKELTNIRYFIDEKCIQIESKREIRKRLGYSPDHADACAICFDDEDVAGETVCKFI